MRHLGGWMAISALIALTACGRDAKQEPPAADQPAAAPTAAAGADPAKGAASTSPIPSGTRTLVVGVSTGWDDKLVGLRLWHRDGAGWKPDGPAWAGVLGEQGAAWGKGLHGDGQPPRQNGPVKQEGDGRAPAGVFALTGLYGYAAAGLGKLPYTPVTKHWHCIDDPESSHYNEIIDDQKVSSDWSSSEEMRRDDDLYQWVVAVDHNRAAVKRAGSCVFLHVWRNGRRGTAGCTAMALPNMQRMLAALDPADHPVYVLLPAAEYDALAADWGLPPR